MIKNLAFETTDPHMVVCALGRSTGDTWEDHSVDLDTLNVGTHRYPVATAMRNTTGDLTAVLEDLLIVKHESGPTVVIPPNQDLFPVFENNQLVGLAYRKDEDQ